MHNLLYSIIMLSLSLLQDYWSQFIGEFGSLFMVKASPFPRSPRRYNVSKRRDCKPAKRPKRRGEGGGGRDANRNVT